MKSALSSSLPLARILHAVAESVSFSPRKTHETPTRSATTGCRTFAPSSLSDLDSRVRLKRENLCDKWSGPLDRLLNRHCVPEKPRLSPLFSARSAVLAAWREGPLRHGQRFALKAAPSSQVRQAARRGISGLAALALLATGCQHQPTSAAVPPAPVATTAVAPTPSADPATAYLFGWGDVPADTAKPRGGSSRGAPVTLAPEQPLPLPAIAQAARAFDRDRAAILALAGDYKVSFHFLETLGFAPDHQAPRPYHSWATEHVRVIEDTGRFISLQHTLVMFFKKEDGTVSEPSLVKHWRQDWTYEPAELHTYRGNNTWARRRPSAGETRGAWSQSVWQVDDSPRYAALGRWTHDGNRTIWTGGNSWRPLPRREHTVRKDYGVMEGSHRIILTPTGWLHEQLNWKRVVGESAPSAAYVGEEWGLDRYERITAPSLAAADEYWTKTGAYWAAVRQAWADAYTRHDRFSLKIKADGKRLFEEHFAYVEKLENGQPYDPADGVRHARETIAKFLIETP